MSDDNSPSIEDQVNQVLSQIGEDGKIPEDIDPMLRYAATAEKRRRDTQSSYTKINMRAKQLEAENAKLFETYENTATSSFTQEEQAELAELKSQDPDAWHARLTEIKDSKKNQILSTKDEISKAASQATELEQREAALIAFNEANPDIAITDEVIENDIPPRITKQLAKGEITFEDFLDKCKTYLTTGKVVKPVPAPDDSIDLDDVPGGAKPNEESLAKANKTDYKNEIY